MLLCYNIMVAFMYQSGMMLSLLARLLIALLLVSLLLIAVKWGMQP